MALDLAKVTLCFAQHAYGWTENYFLPAPSVDLAPEIAKAFTLGSKRAALLGKEATIPFIKISRETLLRDVYVQGTALAGNPSKPADAPDTALLINRWPSVLSIKSPLYLRGLWDEVVLTGGEFDFANADYLAVWNAYASYCFSAGFGFVGRDPSARKTSPLTDVSQNPDGTVAIQARDNVFLGIAAGTKLKVFCSGITGAASVNGPNIVVVNTNTTCTTVKRIPMLAYQSGGVISFNVLQFWKFDTLLRERIVERKVGRPSYLSRGRSRGRKLA